MEPSLKGTNPLVFFSQPLTHVRYGWHLRPLLVASAPMLTEGRSVACTGVNLFYLLFYFCYLISVGNSTHTIKELMRS
jgi:hypothetical protein